MYIRRATATIVLASLLLVLGSCVVVMNRKFEAEHRFYALDSVWNVGVPYLVALGHTANRSVWDSQIYTAHIPFASPVARDAFSELRRAVATSYLHIDSVQITLLESGIRVSRPILIRNEPARDSGYVIVGGSQSYVEDYIPILISDTVTIPADEDSVRVEFSIRTLRKDTNEFLEKPFSFTLSRREGKKLALDAR